MTPSRALADLAQSRRDGQLLTVAIFLFTLSLPHTKEAAMTKWLGPKVAADAIHACLILHGHYGYNMDSLLEQRWRDVVGFQIGDGVPEIMKGVIAREAFGREYTSYR